MCNQDVAESLDRLTTNLFDLRTSPTDKRKQSTLQTLNSLGFAAYALDFRGFGETARDETVACLMLRVHHVTGVPSYQQRLVFDYVELKASDTRLCDCGIEADAALHLLVDTTAPFSVNMGQHDTAPQKRARGSGDSY